MATTILLPKRERVGDYDSLLNPTHVDAGGVLTHPPGAKSGQRIWNSENHWGKIPGAKSGQRIWNSEIQTPGSKIRGANSRQRIWNSQIPNPGQNPGNGFGTLKSKTPTLMIWRTLKRKRCVGNEIEKTNTENTTQTTKTQQNTHKTQQHTM